MASLYKRANARQRRILRVVEGAVKNVADHHGHVYDPYLARSIAKRAAGTLTAQWPDVLALPNQEVPDKLGSHPATDQAKGGRTVGLPPLGRGKQTVTSPSRLIRQIIKDISKQIGPTKKTDPAKAEGLIEALRIIDAATRD